MKLRCTRGAPYEYRDPVTGEQFFSCSQVLKVLDPDLYAGVDDVVMELAQQRGTDLHRVFFYWMASLKGLCARPERPKEFGGYYDAIGKFIADYRPEPILLEESSVNRKWGVAGTPDAKLWVAKKIDMPDLKTTASTHRIHRVQLNCYRSFDEYQDVQTMHNLYIHSDGTYDYVPVDRSPFAIAWLENGVNVLRGRMMDDE